MPNILLIHLPYSFDVTVASRFLNAMQFCIIYELPYFLMFPSSLKEYLKQ